jgi:hypothetical protein
LKQEREDSGGITRLECEDRLSSSARKENVLSDKENMDTKEDEALRAKNDERASADVEGHRYLTKTQDQSDDVESGDTPDVEGHKVNLKHVAKDENGEDDGTPDVEAHRVASRNHL